MYNRLLISLDFKLLNSYSDSAISVFEVRRNAGTQVRRYALKKKNKVRYSSYALPPAKERNSKERTT